MAAVPQKGNFNGLLGAVGVTVPTGQVAWDLSYRTFPGGGRSPVLRWSLFLRDNSFSADSQIAAGLQSVVAMMSGHVEPANKEGLRVQAAADDARQRDDACVERHGAQG